MKNWPESKSLRDIQVFLSFANFYQHFIQGFSKIAGPLTSILRTSSPIGLSTILQSINMADEDEVCESNSNKTNLSNPSALTRSTGAGYLTSGGAKRGGDNTKKCVKVARRSDYLTLAAKKAFNHLRHAFSQALILQHFDLERHIRIETDTSSYAIVKIPNQLILDNLGQWNLVVYYSQKMLTAKIWYKTHDGNLLALVEAFKTWWHYLKDCKHKVLVFTNHNNLCR